MKKFLFYTLTLEYYLIFYKNGIMIINFLKIFFKFNIFRFGHHLTVKRIQFQPLLNKTDVRYRQDILQMASCGADTIVRVYDIFLKKC